MNSSNSILYAIAALAGIALTGIIVLAALSVDVPEALNTALAALIGILPGFVIGQKVGATETKADAALQQLNKDG